MLTAALMLTAISEVSYRRTEKTLGIGIALTEARINTARVLQLLTDADSAQRGYLLTGNPEYVAELMAAHSEFQQSFDVFDFFRGIGSAGPQDAMHIAQEVSSRFIALERSIELAQSGDPGAALAMVESDGSKRSLDSLRAMFESKFKEAAVSQQGARDLIYAALWFNRGAVALLSIVVAFGLYLHIRQVKRIDLERVDRQQTLEKEVAARTTELRNLAAYMQTVREDEKSHLARELHDELGGMLTAAKLILARMRVKLAQDPEMLERIEHINRRLSEGIALKRRIIEDLRPSTLSALGLNTALIILCTEAHKQLNIPVNTQLSDVKLTPEAELSIFRIVQEALTNVGKYAAATQVAVRLWKTDDDLVLQITDNGVGFDVSLLEAGRHGLAGMRFRVESLSGALSVTSDAGQGTTIVARLPRAVVDRNEEQDPAHEPPATPSEILDVRQLLLPIA